MALAPATDATILPNGRRPSRKASLKPQKIEASSPATTEELMFRAKPKLNAEANTRTPAIRAGFTPFQILKLIRDRQPSARLICASIVVSAEADVAAAPCLIGCHRPSAHPWRRWHKFVFHIQGKHLPALGPAFGCFGISLRCAS
jgi:hypothetical protein